MIERLKKLSKRELVLIYVLIIIVIITIGIFFLIKPAIYRADNIDAEYQKAKLKAKQIESTIDQKDEAKIEIAEYNKKNKTVRKQFQKNLKNEEIDELITGMIKSSGLTPKTLLINGSKTAATTDKTTTNNNTGDTTQDETIENNSSSTTNKDSSTSTAIENNAGTDDTNTSNGNTKNAKYNNIKADTVSASAGGTLSQCISLIENTRKTKGLRVASFSITSQEVNTNILDTSANVSSKSSTTATKVEYVLEITFELYELKN